MESPGWEEAELAELAELADGVAAQLRADTRKEAGSKKALRGRTAGGQAPAPSPQPHILLEPADHQALFQQLVQLRQVAGAPHVVALVGGVEAVQRGAGVAVPAVPTPTCRGRGGGWRGSCPARRGRRSTCRQYRQAVPTGNTDRQYRCQREPLMPRCWRRGWCRWAGQQSMTTGRTHDNWKNPGRGTWQLPPAA